jgi:hypothetical protein
MIKRLVTIKPFFKSDKTPSAKNQEDTTKDEELDSNKYIFLVYVQWSKENRKIKAYMKTRNLKSESDTACNGLSDLVAKPGMRLNYKNITMIILYQLHDDHDISKDFDVTGIVPTRLDHYLNSDPSQRIDFSQEQIDDIVNKTDFTYRTL